MNQIIQWCGAEAFEGALVLDECHKAKNMGNGKTKSDKVTEEGRDDLDAWKAMPPGPPEISVPLILRVLRNLCPFGLPFGGCEP